MQANPPTLLALDFDGVLCDGLIEYFQTSWRTYCQVWSPPEATPPEDLAPRFYRLRPAIETGWEMPVLLRALVLGLSEEEVLQDWPTVCQQILTAEGLEAKTLARGLDAVRDDWIATDLESWLNLHRFYPGTISRLNALQSDRNLRVFIVTTKEGRFVRQLLQQQGVQFPQSSIIGKESKRPKPATLRQLLASSESEAASLWFVEDRLQTLQQVQQQSDLHSIRLFLAEWGYNTAQAKQMADNDPRITVLSLERFNQDFWAWQ